MQPVLQIVEQIEQPVHQPNSDYDQEHASEDDWSICSEHYAPDDIISPQVPQFNPNTLDRNSFKLVAQKIKQFEDLQEKFESVQQENVKLREEVLKAKPIQRDQEVNTDLRSD